jgi:DMSO/TMAO reductase YedYZ heme-binding membrane subunit
VNPQVWWFVARSSGIIAWALVTLAVCWGLFLSSRAFSRAVSPAWLLDLHRYLGGLAVTFTAIHLVGIAADNYITFGWFEMFVPMASSWRPGAVAFGVVGLYLLVAIELTSLWMKRLPRRLWRWVHRTSFVLYGIATYHAFVAGTDTDNGWFRIAAYVSIVVVVGLTVMLVRTSRGRPIPSIRRRLPSMSAPASANRAD